MTDRSTSESIQPAEPVISGPAIIAAIFLALHLLPLVWRRNPLWGVDFLFYLPPPVQALFALLAVLLFIPGLRREIRSRAGALPFAVWGRGGRVWITRALILLVALAAFFALCSARHFLGDGYHVLEKLNAENWPDAHRAPLTYAVIGALHRLGSVLWHTAENTYRAYSYASGVLYVALSFMVAAAIGKDRLQKSVVLAFLLTTGYMQLFFGYVENYPLYMPGVLLFIFVGSRTLEGRTSPIMPALILGFLLAAHRAFAVFGPPLLYLAYRVWRDRQGNQSSLKNALTIVAALCCAPACAAFLLGISGVSFAAYLGGTGEDEFLPVFAEPGFREQYRLFSPANLLDFLNQQMLAAPAACMALFILQKRDVMSQPFLAASAAFPLLFTFAANSEIGAFRDWDIFALPALPLTLWAAVGILNRVRDRDQLYHATFLICGAAAVHSLVWVVLNADPRAAEARFLQQTTRLDKKAGSECWSVLGNYYGSQERNDLALNAFKRAIEASPENAWHNLSIARVYSGLGQKQLAIDHIKRAIEIRPDHAVPYMNLGATYSEMGQYEKAIEYTRKAIALQPGLAAAHRNLGAIYQRTGQLAKAIAELKQAVALEPQDPTAYGNLGAVYCDVGQFDEAIECLKEAIRLKPDYGLAYANLGYAYRSLSRYRLAIEHLEKALEMQGDRPNAMTYLNIGDTYYAMGELEKAIPYYQNRIRLNPDHATAHLLLGLSFRALKRDDEARAHLEKTLELDPGHPQAARIRAWLERARE